MPKVQYLIDESILRDLLADYRESFNDCACCPCYPAKCEGEHEEDNSCVDFMIETFAKKFEKRG